MAHRMAHHGMDGCDSEHPGFSYFLSGNVSLLFYSWTKWPSVVVAAYQSQLLHCNLCRPMAAFPLSSHPPHLSLFIGKHDHHTTIRGLRGTWRDLKGPGEANRTFRWDQASSTRPMSLAWKRPNCLHFVTTWLTANIEPSPRDLPLSPYWFPSQLQFTLIRPSAIHLFVWSDQAWFVNCIVILICGREDGLNLGERVLSML